MEFCPVLIHGFGWSVDLQWATAYAHRAYLYNELSQYEKAPLDCRKAIVLEPQYIMAYYERGFAYGKLGRYDEAIADYKEILEIDPAETNAKSILRQIRVPGY